MTTDLTDLGFKPATATAGPAVAPSAPTASATDLSDLGFKPSGATGAVAPPANTGATPTPVPSASSAWLPASASDNSSYPGAAAIAGGKTLANLIPSAVNTGIGLAKMPFQVLGDLTKIPGAVSANVQRKGLIPGLADSIGNGVANYAYDNLIPDVVKQGAKAAVGGAVKATGLDKALGQPGAGSRAVTQGLEGAQADIENDPVGSILPFILVARGVAEKSGYGKQFDAAVSKVGKVGATPLTAAADSLGWLKNGVAGTTGHVVAQISGLNPNVVSEVTSNPGAFSKAKMGEVSASNIVGQVKGALDTRIGQLDESGQAYGPLRASGASVTVDPNWLPETLQKETGLTLTTDGRLTPDAMSTVDAPTDVGKVQRLYKAWKPIFDSGTMTADQYLTFRSKLAQIANYEGIGKSNSLEGAASRMRGSFNTKYGDQLPGLRDELDTAGNVKTPGLDSKFHDQATELRTLRKGLLDANDNLTDSAERMITNSGNRGNSAKLARLEELVPGITAKLKIYKAVQDIENAGGPKVGTYGRAVGATGGGAAGFALAGPLGILPGIIAEMALTDPKVVVPMLRAYGYSANLVSATMEQLGQLASAVNHAPEILSGQKPLNTLMPSAIKKIPKSVMPKKKTIAS